MIASETVEARAERVAKLIEERLGVRGRGLETKLRRAGRMLPNWVRREAERIVEARRLVQHPKLMRQTDPQALERAAERCERWLKSIDPWERRKDRILGFLAVNAFNLIVIAAAFVAFLVWRGYV